MITNTIWAHVRSYKSRFTYKICIISSNQHSNLECTFHHATRYRPTDPRSPHPSPRLDMEHRFSHLFWFTQSQWNSHLMPTKAAELMSTKWRISMKSSACWNSIEADDNVHLAVIWAKRDSMRNMSELTADLVWTLDEVKSSLMLCTWNFCSSGEEN